MSRFIERSANQTSIKGRKLVCGVGINDAWYMTHIKLDCGTKVKCPYYSVWVNMLTRCYNSKLEVYSDCFVCAEWLRFSTFTKWMKNQNWESKQLDKDLLVIGNKMYCAEACIFVSSQLNSLLTDRRRARGDYLLGVNWDKRDKLFIAKCNSNGKQNVVGRFTSEAAAGPAYCTFKAKVITTAAYEEEAAALPKLQEALFRHAKIFSDRADELQGELNEQ